MNPALIAFELVARMNRIDVDIRAIAREFSIGEQITVDELLRIAKANDFKAKRKKLTAKQVGSGYPLPALVIDRVGVYSVLLKLDPKQDKALLFDPVHRKSFELSYAQLDERVADYLILRHKKISSQVVFGFNWFLQEILHFKRIIAEVLLGSFVVQLFGLVTPLFTQVILDKVIVHRSLTTLDVLAIAFLAVAVFELLLNISRNYIFIHTAHKLDAKLGCKLFKHLLGLPFRYFEARQVGTIAARVRELDNIREFITNKAVTVVIDLFFSLVFVAVMLLYSVKLTLVALAFVSLIALIYLVITPELRRRLESKFQMGAQSNSYLVESVTGIQTVKSLAVEGTMQNRWEDHLGGYVKSSFSLANIANIAGAISGTLRQLMTISILYLGVKAVLQGDLTIGQLIAFQMFAAQFSGPVLRLVNLWHEFQQALLSVDRLGDILNHPREVSSDKAITLPRLKGSLKLDHLSFTYHPDGPRVLDGISVEIKEGMSVGVVGRSGSGKSTLAKLLQRLYLPTEGAIYIDDIDSRHMNPFWLRYNIGVVLQESYLFSGTIRDNIALPKPDAPMELILQVAQIAGAHEFIAQLPEGYDTPVSERGASLSGGQRQRIAIARALINNPRLLIFDEATSALDYESEHIIQQNMKKIKQGRTTLIVAHRLATIKECDLILVLDKGKLVESGRHEQLLQQRGVYAGLHAQQGF
ncbi:peptidase domain-containing ABC transporter [Pelovirga terrestris]|uniref:Type I secretion system permease/ATPase n=1 Tax=Pelovirga terrestris TaxID=2771352 RepID=A0A8J6QYL8_9BACT|nr:type I secretion system permease/ATPase [Pelovirga terrestris]MBD1400752.1 type I secretion system permease/ATPase [Pelovirga terrestris]